MYVKSASSDPSSAISPDFWAMPKGGTPWRAWTSEAQRREWTDKQFYDLAPFCNMSRGPPLQSIPGLTVVRGVPTRRDNVWRFSQR
jgi:hypothetical protein